MIINKIIPTLDSSDPTNQISIKVGANSFLTNE